MIKLESAHIEEMRGIRKLDIDFQKGTFAISGPNGSGKSGVIDAIEFGLTGQIGRLMGRGTKGLSISEHGPHVDKKQFPDAAAVELRLFLPATGKSVTVSRKVSSPKKPKITPASDEVKAALAEIADHPEITLSRREILRFILVEPTKRSEEIQSILKLDDIGHLRSALSSAQNKLQQAQRTCAAQVDATRTALQRHLQIATLRQEDLLGAVNESRKVLELPAITSMSADTRVDAGLSNNARPSDFNKESALRDIKALEDTAKAFPELAKKESAALLSALATLEADPALLAALQQRSFIEKGLELVTGAECPLCDTAWPSDRQLREHLRTKLKKSDDARRISESLIKNATIIAETTIGASGVIASVQKLAQEQGEAALAQTLSNWKAQLEGQAAKLSDVDQLFGLKERLAHGWFEVPAGFSKTLKAFGEKIEGKPDQTATLDAQTFLSTAQLRLTDYRESMRKLKAAEIAWTSASVAYDTYCRVLEDELNALYDEVQKDFSAYYRAINEDDEATFTAKLTPAEGSLSLDVNFYDRGLFPPAAFHSEGHQDSMGVCLYLALMKRLFAERFTFALLDDVVMSVDAGHRYQFCKLLKTHFADTQFIITTHDRLWAEQMKSAGLVTSKRSIAFHSWTVDHGPLVESNEEIWQEIAGSLAKGKIEAAAAALRHHLEYVSRHLANDLGAAPQFRADGNYELGELLPPVLKRAKELYGKAADCAQSWGKTADKEAASARRAALSSSSGAMNVEQWAVNKAVHYNEWANFGRKDFEPVVAAFKELLECFTCDKCNSWLYVTPRSNPESLRCACNEVSLNLKVKPK